MIAPRHLYVTRDVVPQRAREITLMFFPPPTITLWDRELQTYLVYYNAEAFNLKRLEQDDAEVPGSAPDPSLLSEAPGDAEADRPR
jgi:hypothetical protein